MISEVYNTAIGGVSVEVTEDNEKCSSAMDANAWNVHSPYLSSSLTSKKEKHFTIFLKNGKMPRKEQGRSLLSLQI